MDVHRRRQVLATLFATLVVAVQPVLAADPPYPTQPLKMLVGFAAGGPTDIVARTVGDGLSKALGQTVIVENKPGANASIAANAVARSKPDGHTLFVPATNHTITAVIFKDLPYDADKSFRPVSNLAVSPTVLVVNNDFPARNYAEFIAAVKASPGKYSYGSAGPGGTPHLAAELFKLVTRTEITHVPYKGAAPAIADLMAGHVQMSFATLGSIVAQLKANRIRAIAVASPTRSTLLPDVPTFEESGLKNFRVDSWYGLSLPAGTPEPIVRKINDEVQKILRSPDYANKLSSLGLEPIVDSGPEKFAAQIRDDIRMYGDLVRTTNLKVE